MTGAHTAPKKAAIADPAMTNDDNANVTPKTAPVAAAAAVQKKAGKSAAIVKPVSFAATSRPGASAAVAEKVSVLAAVIHRSASKSAGTNPCTRKN